MIRRGPTAASVLAAVLALSANSAVAASPADSLVLNPDQVPGLRAGKVSTAVAGQTIAQVLPPSLRGGHAEARAFTGQGVRLAIAAVSLKTQAGARLALRTVASPLGVTKTYCTAGLGMGAPGTTSGSALMDSRNLRYT